MILRHGAVLLAMVSPLATATALAQTASPAPQAAPGTAATQATADTTAAQAAQPAATPAEPAAAAEEIVVTGSRIARNGFKAPSPTAVLDSEALTQRGATNIAESLNDIPAFNPTTSTATAGARPFAPAANYANLRNLGPTRTLVLVNGRRFAPSVPSFGTVGANQTDLNLIPPILLQRAEVVTGGASAQYGSDAVAGVVNLILNNKYTGIKLEVEKGVSTYGDNAESRVAAMVGHAFAGDRGHIVIAGEYLKNDGVGDIYTRPWGYRDTQIVANPSGLPHQIISDNTRLSTMTTGGIITAGPLRGTVFGPGGTTSQFTYGSLVGSTFMVGGGVPNFGLANGILLVPEIERASGFGHAEYEVSDAISVFAEGSYGFSNTLSYGFQPRNPGNITILVSNPYLPASVRTAAAAAGVTQFSFGRISDDIGHIAIRVGNKNYRLATGLSGRFGGSWTWDGYYQYGRNDYHQLQIGQLNTANFALATDAALNASGQVVCRSTLTSPSNGCVPINLFGQGSPSAAAIQYVTGTSDTSTLYQQHVAALNLRGEPFSSWAGPVSIATGIEYRHESQLTTADAISQQNLYNQQNPKPLVGSFSVAEGYLETVVPLLRDSAIAKSVNFNGAVRYAHYSTVGGVVTWKLGGTWEVNDWLLLRTTRSRDIRAPNIFELHAAPTPTRSTIVDPFTNNQVTVTQVLSGNPNLKQETANTFSAGGVLTLPFFRGFQVSADYYRINLTNAITSVLANAVNICYQTGNPFFCNGIVRNGAGVITTVNAPYFNLGSLLSEGIDIEAQYRTRLLGGTTTIRGLGTYALHARTDTGLGVMDYVNTTSAAGNATGTPRFRGTLTTTYDIGGFSGSVQLNYIAPGKFDSTLVEGVDIADNRIPARLYTLVSASQRIKTGGRSFQLFGSINNLFNVAPPRAPSASFFYPTNPAYYDTIGRNFRIGVKVEL